MKKHHFHTKIEDLKKDLTEFTTSWDRAQQNGILIDQKKFLDGLAEKILRLDRHAKEVGEIPEWKEFASQVHFILHTPWGAPIVSDRTLLQAAITYPDEVPESSSLSYLLHKVEHCGKTSEFPILKQLHSLLEELS